MIRLGCIADDLTGATDLANNLVRAGMRVIETVGVPEEEGSPEVDALVIALKSRTIPAADAVSLSRSACRWLVSHGASQIYFKICSTFDSSPRGNIGPVIEALMEELGCRFSVVTPAFPENRRTVFNGHLFVDDQLLSDTGMRNHPLTPMRDSNLVRFLQLQTTGKVGLIDYRIVSQSPEAIRNRAHQLESKGVSIAIVDAIDNDDLLRIAAAVKDTLLVTAASGLAIGLPENWGIGISDASSVLPRGSGRRAIVAGSCSATSNAQVRHFIDKGGCALQLDPVAIAAHFDDTVIQTLFRVEEAWKLDSHSPVLIYSTADANSVKSVQQQLGVERSGTIIESALAAIAKGLVERGARQLILAGGETAGASMHALDVRKLQIGRQIDPGVPWCYCAECALPGVDLHLALKSGNFGSVDFFMKAFALIA